MYNHHITAVHVEATDRCNAQCPVCVRSYQGGPVNNIVTDSELGISHFIDYLGDDFCSKVASWNFCGNKGDPSSALELLDIFEYILKCKPDTKIDMRTNGGARSEKFWSRLGALFKDTNCNVVFAVDGLEDTNHIYRKNVKWSNLYRNMKAYFKNGGYGRGWFDTLKFKHNEHQWNEIEALSKRFGVSTNFKEPWGFAKLPNGKLKTIPVYDRHPDWQGNYNPLYTIKPHGDVEYEDPAYEPVVKEDVNQNGAFYDYKYDELFKYSNTAISCVANQPDKNHYEIFLDCDGSVYPCCFIGSRINYGEKQLDAMLKDENIVLSSNNTIHDILKSRFFQKTVPDGISGKFINADLTIEGKTNHCLTCVDCCGMKMELSHMKQS